MCVCSLTSWALSDKVTYVCTNDIVVAYACITYADDQQVPIYLYIANNLTYATHLHY